MTAVFFLVLLAVLEIFVVVRVAEAIGVGLTLLLLIITTPLGWRLMRSQGRSAARRFAAAADEHRVPAREALDGVLIFLGGMLLVIPGFITDVVGLLLLLPPSRAVARGWAARRHWAGRVVMAASSATNAGPWRARTAAEPYDVEGHVVEEDPPELRG
jgi:UPF0716 protein FxsA